MNIHSGGVVMISANESYDYELLR